MNRLRRAVDDVIHNLIAYLSVVAFGGFFGAVAYIAEWVS